MNEIAPAIAPRPPDARLDGIVKLAVMAVGGQGGGVLTNWIESLARAEGYACQATSVAGVAQRTGATIYYVEMVKGGGQPVFSLAPAGGDVDILIAAELMEAGRAILRGFVTPDRTTLIASTHRALAVSEKTVPGDGIASADEVRAAAEIAARRLVMADMERLAVAHGSVISASLFGALAGAAVLPFERSAYEDAIRRGGRGVEPSLAAFAAGFDAARGAEALDVAAAETPPAEDSPQGPAAALSGWSALQTRAKALPGPVSDMALPGLRKVVGFQDVDYGREYLDRLDTILAADRAPDFTLGREAAKYIANAMAYDDVIRVADLKTRRARFSRIRTEMGAGDGTLMQVTEFMHPRAEEIVGMMPARLGARLEASPHWMRRIDWLFNRGRRLRTDGLRAYLMLYLLAGMRNRRRGTLRHRQEQAHLDAWIARAMSHADANYDLAVEIVRCRRLIKGYSDTHARGLSKFDRVLDGAALISDRDDAAEWVARLRTAALADDTGEALDGALATIRSFAE